MGAEGPPGIPAGGLLGGGPEGGGPLGGPLGGEEAISVFKPSGCSEFRQQLKAMLLGLPTIGTLPIPGTPDKFR